MNDDRTPETGYSDISCTVDQCALSGAVMSTELEVSIERKKDKVFLKRLQLFFQPFCKRERKIMSQYKGNIPLVLRSERNTC